MICPDDLPTPDVIDVAKPAGIAWLVIIAGVILFELWAIRTHHWTLSQRVQHGSRWLRWVAEAGVIVLGLHLWGWL